jgi:hypothetical protein
VSVVITVVPWLLKDSERYYFVTAKGYGRTTEEARTQALRAAVDQAVGSVVNSEREVKINVLNAVKWYSMPRALWIVMKSNELSKKTVLWP